jgi:DNA-binding beta-propeller fold protein YncE
VIKFPNASKLLSAISLVTTLSLGGVTFSPVAYSQTPQLGDAKVFAPVPTPPGFPEGIAVQNDRVYVCGPAAFGNPLPQAKVIVYDLKTGTQLNQYSIPDNPLNSQAHVLAGCTFNEKSWLYIVDTHWGVRRVNVQNPNIQQNYAPPLPDLPTCKLAGAGIPCSPTQNPNPPLPNDIVFDKNGYAYISDSQQATIFRIPPGGGQPQIWFQSPALDGDFGANGLRIDPTGQKLYIAQTFGSLGKGFIYTLPLVERPLASDLQTFYEYDPQVLVDQTTGQLQIIPQAPDGIAFGASGKLYVALALSNAISVLNPNGTEVARYSQPATIPGTAPVQTLPLTNPANIAFNDQTGSLLVTNHASLVSFDPNLFAIIEIFVNDKAAE